MSEAMKKEAEKYGIPYEKYGRVLVWHDEFNKGEIDFDKWKFHRTMSGKDRVYDNSEKCCRIEGDKLLLQTHRNDDAEKPFRLSEGFTTRDRMLFKYGYVEMRARFPFKHGSWGSFWTQSCTPFSAADWFAEIDIVEIFSSENSLCSNTHKWQRKADGSGYLHCSVDGEEYHDDRRYTFKNSENLNNEYHTYGFMWDKDNMTFYIDDVPYKTFSLDPVLGNYKSEKIDGTLAFHDYMFLILNNELFTPNGTCWDKSMTVTDDDSLPFDYYVDWVRLYQNPETEEIKLKSEILSKIEKDGSKKF